MHQAVIKEDKERHTFYKEQLIRDFLKGI